MLRIVPANDQTKLPWANRRFFRHFLKLSDNQNILAVTDYIGAHGAFASATRTTAGTTAVVTPISGGSIILTDIIISGEKQASSTVEIRFTDGTNDVAVFLASQVDAPPNIAIPLRGRWQGWKDARIDMITSGAGDATVALGYAKFSRGLEFADWNARR